MSTPNGNNNLLSEPVPGLLRRLAVPVGIGFFFNTMFNVVDTFYGGLISTQAIASLSLSFPIFFLIIAAGAGISTGSTALIGHALGADNLPEARRYAVQTISFGLINGLILSLCGHLFIPHLFRLLGAQGEYLQLALGYMNVIFGGAVLFLGNQVLNSSLNASGDTRSFRNFLIVGFFLNLVLDPWFLFGGFGLPHLGLAGIAWATVVVQGVGNFYLYTRVRLTGLLDGATPRMLIPQWRYYREIARQGFPASLNMLTVAIGIFVITWFLSRFGTDTVAAYGIGSRIEQIALLPVMGLNVATLALVAQNSGARQMERVRQTIRTALTAGVALMAGGAVIVYLLAGELMGLFTRDQAVIDIGSGYLHVAAFIFCAYVILYINVFALQGLKKPMFAIWLGIFRQVAAPVLAFYLLAYHLEWGVAGIWWGIFLVTWTAAFISIAYVRYVVRKLLENGGVVGN